MEIHRIVNILTGVMLVLFSTVISYFFRFRFMDPFFFTFAVLVYALTLYWIVFILTE